MYMKKLFITLYLFILILNQTMYAQPTVQDCMGAIPICLNTYDEHNGYTGVGTISDIPTNSCPVTCMSAGERNSVWYTFSVQTTGWFDFRITPWVMADDYDWALFNLTTDDCSALSNTTALPYLEVSCNWSADGGITGANSLSPTTWTDCWGSAAIANNPQVWVTAGSTYYLNISNYTGYGAGHGYQLDMTNGTAVIFDNVRPYLLPIPNPTCGGTSVVITMSENVLCNTVSTADFTIAGQTVTAINGANCAAGATMENTFTLTLSPGLPPGVHTVCINGSDGHIADLCGNLTDPSNPNNCRSITVSGVATTVSASPTSVCNGVASTLTAAGATSYSWSDGLGSGNPVSVSPATTTTYTVTGTTALCTSSATVTVTVSTSPTITITATPAGGVCPGTVVTLDATSDMPGTTYLWSTADTGSQITPTVNAQTTYSVTGTSNGCTGSQSITINIASGSVTVSPASDTICSSQSTILTASGATTYSWSPPAGLSALSGPTVTANPTTTTTYTVVGDPTGCSDSETVTITVNAMPTATISGGGNICTNSTTPVTITIALTGTGPWDLTYTNGSTSTTVNAINASPYTFNTTTPGVYTVTSINDVNCAGNSNGAAILNAYPLPIVTLSPPADECINTPVFALTGGTPAGGTYTGPGVAANNFTAATAGAGTHNIIYTYTDGNGCVNSDTNTLTVNALPTVTLPALTSVCLGAPAFALAGGTPAGGVYSGPGVVGGIFTPANAGLGTHTITYTYTDGNSCVNSATNTLTVNAGPVVALAVLPDVCVDATAFALSGGTPAGGTYSGTGVSNNFFDPATSGAGSFTVTYTYTDPTSSCVATATQSQVVFALPVVTHSTLNDVCASTPSFLLTGGTPAGGTYSGTGVVNNIFDPGTVGIGNQVITYTYTDPNTMCTNSVNTNFQVILNIMVSVDPTSTYICEGASATLTATGASSFSWSPSTGLTTLVGPAVMATPPSTITYTVTGSNADGCSGQATATVNIYPPVQVTFLTLPGNGCKPLDVQFMYNPTPDVEDSSWMWDFGDVLAEVDTSSQQNPTHIYIEEGNYIVTLTVTSINGCVHSATMPVNVYNKPIADFYWLPEVGNMPIPEITFIDASLGANYWYWNFGDPASGNSNESNYQNPVHIFSDSGTYEVLLVVEANQGCSDSITKFVTIYPEQLIFIPNAFSPDNNSLNDSWSPSLLGITDEGYELTVWDRWGQNIWTSTSVSQRWDGRIGDKVVPAGTYVWVLKYRDPTGKDYKLKGVVSVIR